MLWFQDFNGQLYEKQDLVDQLEAKCNDLQSNGYLSDDDKSAKQVETLQQQHASLQDRADQKLEELTGMQEELSTFQDQLQDTCDVIDRLKGEVASHGPISSEPEHIKEQQEDFKVIGMIV